MSDAFFQKKRKRGGRGEDGKGKSSRSLSNGVAEGEAGPSRLRMREKAGKGASSKQQRKGKQASSDDDDDDEEDSNDGGVENMDLRHQYDGDLQASDEDDMETPAEAKVRLAKLYLEGLRDDEIDPNDADAAEADRQNIAARLQADVSSQTSHAHNFIADRINLPHEGDTTSLLGCRGHLLSVTSVVIDSSCKSIWSAGKDGHMVRWRLRDGKMMERIGKRESEEPDRVKTHRKASNTSGAARRRARAAMQKSSADNNQGRANGSVHEKSINGHTEEYCRRVTLSAEEGHTDEIWAMTTSSDGKYLVSGGKDRRICVWALESGQVTFVKALGGHKDSITALRFRGGSHDLFSASSDRTLKLFDVSQLSYVETFFGHQEEVSSLDVLRGQVAVSAGSRDRTVRWWKVRDESQLVFRGGAKSRVRDVLEGGDMLDDEEEDRVRKHVALQEQHWVEGSIDSVAMIDEHTFLSGGDSGTISLWSLSKKKPIFTAPVAHGFHTVETETEGKVKTPRWITALACLPYGDLFASGSWDGTIRLWKLHSSLKSFSLIHEVPVNGCINALQLSMPSRSVLKKQQGKVIEEAEWRRRGGLRGGAKRVFPQEEEGESVVPHDSDQDGLANGEAKGVIILAAGVGQELSRGRWLRIKEAQNGTVVMPFYLQ